MDGGEEEEEGKEGDGSEEALEGVVGEGGGKNWGERGGGPLHKGVGEIYSPLKRHVTRRTSLIQKMIYSSQLLSRPELGATSRIRRLRTLYRKL